MYISIYQSQQMKQDDYFLNQIDILGRVLGKIIADLLQLKSKGQVMEGIEVASEALKSELDLDINDLLLLPIEKLIAVLQNKNKLNLDHLAKKFSENREIFNRKFYPGRPPPLAQ